MKPIYVRYATKIEKHVLKLDSARDREVVDHDLVAVTILDKSTGNFTLTFKMYDGTEFELDQDELTNGDVIRCDIEWLYLTNTAQPGITIKLLTDKQIFRHAT